MSIAIGTRVRSQSIPAREGVVIDAPGNHLPAPTGFAWVQWEASPDDEQRWDYLAHIEAEGDLIHGDHDTFKQGDLLQHNDLGPVTFLRWGSSDKVIVVQHQGQEHKVFVSDLISEWVTNPEVEHLINTATVFDPVDEWPPAEDSSHVHYVMVISLDERILEGDTSIENAARLVNLALDLHEHDASARPLSEVISS